MDSFDKFINSNQYHLKRILNFGYDTEFIFAAFFEFLTYFHSDKTLNVFYFHLITYIVNFK